MKNGNTAGGLAARLLAIGLIAAAVCGCSRETINYQIAESIGTLGDFENGEPVETPRMREQREQQEALEQQESAFQEQLGAAMRLADAYYYDEALESLEKIERNENNQERLDAAAADVKARAASVKTFEGEIPHLCFPTLIEDPDRAFDGDAMSSTYYGNMITVSEFTAILDSLRSKGYVLVDLHTVAADETDNRGVTTMEYQKIRLPEGKKPIILSQDNVNYAGIKNGDGIATRLVLDDNGDVQALYTDPEGHDLKGPYDFVPALEAYIAEHPDFSYHGARGIVSVSASNGIFGYDISDSAISDPVANRSAVQSIAEKMTRDGWHIASAGYDHSALNELSPEGLLDNLTKWKEEAGSLTGETDILFFPYGYEVEYPSDQLKVLVEEGFRYLCGLWGDKDYMDKGDDYLRQTRRFVDGYTLTNAASYFTSFFDAASLLDEGR